MTNDVITETLGRVVPIHRGTWSSSTAYSLLDIVAYNGGSYMAIKSVPAGTLPTSTSYWQPIASKGDTGAQGAKGDTGDTGPKGDTGDTGNGIASTVLNADYTLTITFTNGTTYTTGVIRGATGNGIASTVLNADYTLTITFTDGTTYTTGSIRGATGAQGAKGDTGDTGNGIASTVLNADYTLTITFTNGTTYTTGSIRGEKGEQGERPVSFSLDPTTGILSVTWAS